MTDTVFIEGLRLAAVIGVHERERHAPQPILLDLHVRVDAGVAAVADSLADALDYEAVAARLTAAVAQTRFQLVETLAEFCAELVLSEFGARGVRVVLRKPQALEGAAAVGVVIERGSFAP